MFEIIKAIISRGGYDLSRLLRKIDGYHAEDKLTNAERDQLYTLARTGGVTAGFDVEAEIGRLWEAIRKLQAAGSNGGNAGAESVAEYITPTGAHDAYFAGDLVNYGGKVYRCSAPEGVACVWSPDDMPAYWTVVEG